MAMTASYAVMGHPVAHSLSPMIHSAFAEACGIDLDYRAIDVPPDGLREAVASFAATGGLGLNITLPHKQAALQLASASSARASHAMAANTLIRQGDEWHAENTDGVGLLRHLQRLGVDAAGADVLIIGAGGAVWGIAGPLLAAKPLSLDICNRTVQKARQLAQHFAGDGEISVLEGLEGKHGKAYDLVINATPSGITGSAINLPHALLKAGGWCYDLAYNQHQDTPFVQWGKQAGAGGASDGLGMLIEQAAESFKLWHGVEPETGELYRLFGR